MLHVLPSKELRNNYSRVSALAKNGDNVVITVNGVGDGVFMSMDTFNNYERLRNTLPVMSKEERAELTKALQECLLYSDDPNSTFYSHEEVAEMVGITKA